MAEWIKTWDPYICYMKETCFISKDTHRLKLRWWIKVFHVNRNPKKAGITILIADKTGFKLNAITRDKGFPGGSELKASACNVGDLGSIPGLGRSPGERNSNPFQYSCLENPMDRWAWWATIHGVAKSQTQLSDFTSLHFKRDKEEHYIIIKGSIQEDTMIISIYTPNTRAPKDIKY